MRLLLIALLAPLVLLASGCCHWCRPQPCPSCPPCPRPACYACDADPNVAFVRECMKGAATPTEKSGCCMRFNSVPGSDADRAALRSCVKECAAP
jgi:hypothetical protein